MNHKLRTSPAAHAALRSGALWHLPRGKALALPEAPMPRWIRLVEGRLWLTEAGAPDALPEDRWLTPGDSLRLAPGARVLAEGWPAASFELLEEPQDGTAKAVLQSAFAFLRGAAGLLGARTRSAASSASRAQGRISAADSIASSGGVQ
jgi:Protein of unknown function (DUF2917)